MFKKTYGFNKNFCSIQPTLLSALNDRVIQLICFQHQNYACPVAFLLSQYLLKYNKARNAPYFIMSLLAGISQTSPIRRILQHLIKTDVESRCI